MFMLFVPVWFFVKKKLEQLLVKFPPEEVESRRWQKIADELGNRTAKQVTELRSARKSAWLYLFVSEHLV